VHTREFGGYLPPVERPDGRHAVEPGENDEPTDAQTAVTGRLR
jgi:hypothetical protein